MGVTEVTASPNFYDARAKDAVREKLRRDTEAYLAKGKQITVEPYGKTTKDLADDIDLNVVMTIAAKEAIARRIKRGKLKHSSASTDF